MMTATKAFLAFCLLAVVGTVLVIGPSELRRLLPGGTTTEIASKPEAKPDVQPAAKTDIAAAAKPDPAAEAKPEAKVESKPKPDEPKRAAVVPPSPSASPAPQPSALADTGRQVATLPDVAPVKPAPADAGPRFDVARVDERGEAAVIAGQAAPGAKVELLRDGKPLDTVVADASGQFVMTPPQLPSGSYELSLRAKAPDGTVTQSGRTMPVTVAAPVAPETRQAEKPADKSDVVAALPSPRLATERSTPSRMTSAAKPRLAAAAPASPADVLRSGPTDASGNRVIARGDSLWALSRLAYGDGARYAVIFNANRDKIHNPNLIYPGQTFVMPPKAE